MYRDSLSATAAAAVTSGFLVILILITATAASDICVCRTNDLVILTIIVAAATAAAASDICVCRANDLIILTIIVAAAADVRVGRVNGLVILIRILIAAATAAADVRVCRVNGLVILIRILIAATASVVVTITAAAENREPDRDSRSARGRSRLRRVGDTHPVRSDFTRRARDGVGDDRRRVRVCHWRRASLPRDDWHDRVYARPPYAGFFFRPFAHALSRLVYRLVARAIYRFCGRSTATSSFRRRSTRCSFISRTSGRSLSVGCRRRRRRRRHSPPPTKLAVANFPRVHLGSVRDATQRRMSRTSG